MKTPHVVMCAPQYIYCLILKQRSVLINQQFYGILSEFEKCDPHLEIDVEAIYIYYINGAWSIPKPLA